jgi:hypothetical protein
MEDQIIRIPDQLKVEKSTNDYVELDDEFYSLINDKLKRMCKVMNMVE